MKSRVFRSGNVTGEGRLGSLKGDQIKMPSILRIGSACVLFLVAASYGQAQTRVKVSSPPSSVRSAAVATAGPSVTPSASLTPSMPTNLDAIGRSNSEIDLSWTASTESGGTIASYRIERCTGAGCENFETVGTSPTTTYSDINSLTNIIQASITYRYQVIAVDADSNESKASAATEVKTASSALTCSLVPLRAGCIDFAQHESSVINAFYQTAGQYSFFNQVKAIYNGASSSTTVSADLASLNFGDGMQVTVATNAQVGTAVTTTPLPGALPTLTASGAAQATQDILYGGTFVVSELYPLAAFGVSKLGSAGGFGLLVNFMAKEGADIQNFKSGTNVSVVSPPFHGSGEIEGYLQYNSINLATASQNFAGALFLGGNYGYSYMSRGYANDYGFSSMHNGLGQISFGIVLNGVARITVSRGFGPSQTYMDNTTKLKTTVDNFKSWSFGIVYQSATPAK